MIKNNYVTAKLRELSAVITKVLKFNEDGNFDESHKCINEALRRLMGLNPEIIENLSYKDLINFIGAHESADSVKFMILAELLKLSADVYKMENDADRSFSLYLKAFNIYVKALLLDKETTLQQCRNNMEDILNEISTFEIPLDNQYSVFQYFELTDRFDKAEDMLYELIETSQNDPDIINEGIHFYERLLEKDEAILETGKLPLDEVKDGLENIRGLI